MKTYIKIVVGCLVALGVACGSDDKTTALNHETIDGLIAACRVDLENAVEGPNLGQYVVGSKALFHSAIDDAQYVRDNTDRQSAIDNYVVKLNVAHTVFVQSKVAMACPYFNGKACIDCGPANQLIGVKYTIEIWVKMSSKTGAGAAIVGAEGSDGKRWDGLMIRRAEGINKALDFCVVNNTWSSCLTPANSFQFDRWTHVACTFDGRNAKVYLDGVETGTMTIGAYETNCWGNLYIGDLAFFRGRFLVGNVYDFRIWNTVRSASQIQESMNILLEGDEEGLVANWQLNVKSGTTVMDVTGKHQATLNDITWGNLDRITE